MSGRWSWAQAKAWHTNAALIGLGVAMFWFSGQYVRESQAYFMGYSGCSSSMAVLYLVSCWLVMTQPVNRWTLPLIFTVAAACNVVTILAPPFSSTDMYRYVWDGIVQHAGINPFRYVPADDALRFLRAPHQAIYDNINRKEYARTIYPPAAQVFDYLVTAILPTVRFYKVCLVLCEALTCWALLKMLVSMGKRREQVLLFAWCPLMIWEFGGGGHMDALAIALFVLALLFRLRGRPVWTGVFLGLAVITKIYPLVLFPALYRRGDWKMPAAMAGVIAAGYALYASVGVLVFGFIGGYAKEEGLDTGTRYFLLEFAQGQPGLHWLTTGAFFVVCAVVLGAISLWAWRVNEQPGAAFLSPALGMAFALMLLFSPHYGWYIAWLIPFFCLVPNLPMAIYVMAFFYGYTTWWADPGPKMFYLNKWLYGVTLLALLIHLALRSWGPYRRNFLAAQELPA